MSTDRDTQDWIRTPIDDLAARQRMRFDAGRAEFACDWIETHCCLYEGDKAGETIELMPFQREFVSRLFGWVRYSHDWKAWIRRFNDASFWSGKKNGKSPLCAAINLLLLIGDGEPGQKVYQGAKNGEQAQFAQMHAINMVLQSPALAAECKVNMARLSIWHQPSNSRLMILTGDDSRGAKGKEGINGSVAFDEMHVVSEEVYRRTNRAGRSRKEPLRLSYSTAGDDLDCAGYQRYQYGRQVNSGERLDYHFLHVDYSIPPEVAETQIDADLETYARMANPAWGSLVKPDDVSLDWDRSKESPSKTAECLQYTFNRWVGSTNRWLNVAGWEKGTQSYGLEHLARRECVAALDLSRTRDMTSCVFAFPWPEVDPEAVRLWPMFWLPEERVSELKHLYSFEDWARAGYLKLTPGSIVDYGIVKDDIRRTINDNGLIVVSLHYDKHMANEITQALHEGETVDGHTVPGVVGDRIDFPQATAFYAPNCKEFERRVAAGILLHPGNPVLTWQAKHVEVKRDSNQEIRPVKPENRTGKSIDGIVCGIMDMAGIVGVKGEWPEGYFARILADDSAWPKPEAIANKVQAVSPDQCQAIVTAALDKRGSLWIDCECPRGTLPDLANRSAELARLHRPRSVAIARGPALLLLLPEFERLARDKRGLPSPIEGVAQTEAKIERRIRRLGSYLSRGQLHVRNSTGGRLLVSQLRGFPKGSVNVAADTLELALQRLEMLV